MPNDNDERRITDRREEIRNLQQTYNKTNVKIELLAQNVERHDKRIEKLHETCDTIKELTSTMSTMIKYHDEDIKTANELVESRRIEREKEVKDLHTRITHSEKETLKIVDEKVKNVKVNDALLDRVRKLENWKWLLMGGGVVLGFMATKLPSLLLALGN